MPRILRRALSCIKRAHDLARGRRSHILCQDLIAWTGRRKVATPMLRVRRHLIQHGHFDMSDRVNSDTTTPRKILRPRRLALLGTVAALGVAVLASSPGSSPFSVNSLIAPAQASEAPATPPGFGDLVAKVKPAVISVRVKIDQDNDKSAMLQQNRMDSDEDSPFDQFSRQFGFRGPNGMNGMPRQRHQMITGEGSGF